jgi:hypothetical protein
MIFSLARKCAKAKAQNGNSRDLFNQVFLFNYFDGKAMSLARLQFKYDVYSIDEKSESNQNLSIPFVSKLHLGTQIRPDQRSGIENPRLSTGHGDRNLSTIVNCNARARNNFGQLSAGFEPCIWKGKRVRAAPSTEVREDRDRLRAGITLAHGKGAAVLVNWIVLVKVN